MCPYCIKMRCLMKRIAIVAALLGFCVIAHAEQCPPSKALSHAGKGQPWVLDKTFSDQGWYVSRDPISENNSKGSYDPAGAVFSTLIYAREFSDSYYSQCKYVDNTSGSGSWITVYNTNHYQIDPAKLPNYTKIDFEEFQCQGIGSDTSRCKW